MNENNYTDFLKRKVQLASSDGFEIQLSEINPILKFHQKLIVQWMIKGGRRACFASFGLGKSVIQLEAVRITREHAGGLGLIVLPLGVRQEFTRDAAMLETPVKFIRRITEVEDERTIYLTNYETIRDGKMDPRAFSVASLDEAACLRGFCGTKIFREYMRLFAGDGKTFKERIRSDGVKHRYVATAVPSPNDYIELLAYAAYLDIMDVSAAKTRFFKRDSVHADRLTIHGHKEEEFWMWVSSWALFVNRPSDIGGDDTGYVMPELTVRWHEVATDHNQAGSTRDGQRRMFCNSAIGVQDSAREKRNSLPLRIEKMQELLAEYPDDNCIIWHDLEAERHAIKKAVPSAVSVYGSQDLEDREKAIIDFSEGRYQYFSSKPSVAGSGCNFQRHCNRAIYLGIGFRFSDFIQALHRIVRFLQDRPVVIDLIYTEAERDIRRVLERKWTQHNIMVKKMTDIIKEYGLSLAAMMNHLTRAVGVERVEVKGENYRLINNDCVLETKRMEKDSVGLILTSIPFSQMYEYSPNIADFGHADTHEHFFQQMDFLIPELLRVIHPGRLCAIHVKDRIVPGGMTGLGFQTVYPFHCKTIEAFCKHGFAYMGMKTIVTDVVRENNQTYRLGWTEQCKDGSKMGVGMPEYLLIFRKPPSDATDGYADRPVVKMKPLSFDVDGNVIPFDRNKKMKPGTGYSRSRWQIDAHGFTRSSGNRLLMPEELDKLPHDVIFKMFRDYSLSEVYNFEHHVTIGETMEAKGSLPVKFMLLQPQSWHPDVWTDITRMLTLNGAQSAKGKEMHLAPLQLDLVNRAIVQWSMKGDVVYDPFAGLCTVPYLAVKLGRYGLGTELSHQYFLDGCMYCKMAEQEMAIPDLFATLEES